MFYNTSKSNVIALRDYAAQRLTQAIVQRLTKALDSLEQINKRALPHQAEKPCSMARLYIIAALMELEKMSLAQENHIMRQ